MKNLGIKTLALGMVACLSLSACSGKMSGADGYSEIPDPLEEVNRTTMKINDAVDKVILEPVFIKSVKIIPKKIDFLIQK